MQEINRSAIERMRQKLDRMLSTPGVLVAVSKCDGDDFLYVVLVERFDDTTGKTKDWVTWWWNDQSHGFSSGHYFNCDVLGMQDFLERARHGWNYERKAALVSEGKLQSTKLKKGGN